MDLGVGSFVFSQGIISARSITSPSTTHMGIVLKLKNVARKALPVIALGILRVIVVKGTEYPVRISIISACRCLITQVALGTCNRIRGALELFLDTRSHPGVTNGIIPLLKQAYVSDNDGLLGFWG
jgi:hypothetical protein